MTFNPRGRAQHSHAQHTYARSHGTGPSRIQLQQVIRNAIASTDFMKATLETSNYLQTFTRLAVEKGLFGSDYSRTDIQGEFKILHEELVTILIDRICKSDNMGSMSEVQSSASFSQSYRPVASSSTSPSGPYIIKAADSTVPPAGTDLAGWIAGVPSFGVPSFGYPNPPQEIKQEAKIKHEAGTKQPDRINTAVPSNPSLRRVSATSSSGHLIPPLPTHTKPSRGPSMKERRRASLNTGTIDMKSETQSIRSTAKEEHLCGFCGKKCKSPSDKSEHEGVHHHSLVAYKRYKCPQCKYRHHRRRDMKRHVDMHHKDYKGGESNGVDEGQFPPDHSRESLLNLWQIRSGFQPPHSPISEASSCHAPRTNNMTLDDRSERKTPTPGHRRTDYASTAADDPNSFISETYAMENLSPTGQRLPARDVDLVDMRLGKSRNDLGSANPSYPKTLLPNDLDNKDTDMTGIDHLTPLPFPSFEDMFQFNGEPCIDTIHSFGNSDGPGEITNTMISPTTAQQDWAMNRPSSSGFVNHHGSESVEFTEMGQFTGFSSNQPELWDTMFLNTPGPSSH